MRILASNPDTLGDLILRQPLYASVLAAGHELALVVRPAAVPLVKYVAPRATVIELACEPYADDFASHLEAVQPTFKAAADFRPELLLIAPYRWTRFDEELAAALPNVKRAGMTGHLYGGNPHAGHAPISSLKFDIVATVDRNDREVLKNAALAQAIVGAPPRSVDPKLNVSDEVRSHAAGVLQQLGLEPANYWIVCVSGTAHVALKAWQPDRWASVLSEFVQQTERGILFVGTHDELASVEAVRAAMSGIAHQQSRTWMPPAGTLDELLGLTELSRGYIGHDTGPMHFAAALKKPVLGVFGGGHGMRFAPAVDPSVALTVNVPCMNCGWICTFATSHCVKDILVDEVLQAALDLEAWRVTSREIRALPPSPVLLSQMVEESAHFARQQMREAGERAKLLAASDHARQSEVSAERLGVTNAQAEVTAARLELQNTLWETETARTEANKANADLAAARSELDRAQSELAQGAKDSSRLSAQLGDHVGAIERLTVRTTAIIERRLAENGHGPGVKDAPASIDPEPVAKLRSQVERLGTELETLRPRYRRPLKELFAEWVIGRKEYPVRPPRPLPRITIVLPTLNAVTHLRETLDSVISQNYHNVEFIIVDGGSTDGTDKLLNEYREHIGLLIVEPDEGPMHGAAKGFEHATGEVLHLLYAGDTLEPGALLRIAEEFSRKQGLQAIYFEDTLTYPDGWRLVPLRRPKLDVMSLLRSETPICDAIFFRRSAYQRLGKLNLSTGRAADWDLWIRLDRRFEIRRRTGHVRSIRATAGAGSAAYQRDLPSARETFLRSFGTAGRIRCQILHFFNSLWERIEGSRDRLFFPAAIGGKPLPPAEPPPLALNQPVCPLSNRHPDQFLFSTRDNNGGDHGLHYVYYDSTTGAAVTYPPLSSEQLNRLYAAQSSLGPRPVVPPDERFASPFRNFAGYSLGDLLMKLPSPLWLFRKPNFGITAADTLMQVISRDVRPANSNARVLNVGCFEGAVLDVLKTVTEWKLYGTETNSAAAAIARAKGFTVWEIPPLEAPLTIPLGDQFDVIFLDGQMEHFQDPVLILRRLRQLLLPGGKIVINQPNLDSKHVEIFGPTWVHWQAPFHRILMGGRGLRQMARLAGLQISRTKTITHPYRTCVSVQMRDLGLGAVVPTDAKFPDDVAVRGINLTGWSKLLWDWRGRGDYLYAVLEMR